MWGGRGGETEKNQDKDKDEIPPAEDLISNLWASLISDQDMVNLESKEANVCLLHPEADGQCIYIRLSLCSNSPYRQQSPASDNSSFVRNPTQDLNVDQYMAHMCERCLLHPFTRLVAADGGRTRARGKKID